MSDLWKTTPVGTIAKRLEDWANGERVGLQGFAIGVAEEFLFDLSADHPVLVVNGEPQRHSCPDLTSQETTERAAQAIDYAFEDTEEATELCRELAEAVLRAVIGGSK